MLTPDDGGADGNLLNYLSNPGKFSGYDTELFGALKMLIEDRLIGNQHERRVSLIENTDLLFNAQFYSCEVPDSSFERKEWFEMLSQQAEECEMVFLDPDNGLEVKSRPYGRKHSSKYVYWLEVEALWAAGKSLLIYQHFPREKRDSFVQRRLADLESATPGSRVEAFTTSHVVFLMALQPRDQVFREGVIRGVEERWGGEIQHSKLVR